MILTREHIALTFPTLGALALNTSDQVFGHLLASEIAGFTDNIEYAADIAVVIMSHVADAPYSELPRKLQSYRASIDLFLLVAPEERVTQYLRSIARATCLKRNARRFHQSLLASTRKFNLTIPDAMLAAFDAPATIDVHLRLPLPVHHSLKAQAKAAGISISELIREKLYAKDGYAEDEGSYT